MTQYFAFLRAINVGGRNIKMDQLRQLFKDMGFVNVETFIASGNVIFDADETERKTLERQIETNLQAALGYTVDTFVRTFPDLLSIQADQPFPNSELEGNTLYIGFLAGPPNDEAEQALQAFTTEVDSFHINGSEVYWLCRKTISQSDFSGAKLEKALDMPATLRNQNTINRLIKKYQSNQTTKV